MLKTCLSEELFNRVVSDSAVDPNFEPPDPGILPTWNGATGEFIKNVPLLKMVRVSRRRFRTLCAEGIDIQASDSLPNCSTNSATISPPLMLLVVWQKPSRHHYIRLHGHATDSNRPLHGQHQRNRHFDDRRRRLALGRS